MATAFAMAATQTPTTTIKKPGPPVPPRPQQTSATAILLKAQRESFVNATTNNRVATITKTTIISATEPTPPVVKKKPTLPAQTQQGVAAGRTVIYKSPSLKQQPNFPEAERVVEEKELAKRLPECSILPVSPLPRTAYQTNGVSPRVPPKMRKAPDVPITKPRLSNKALPNNEEPPSFDNNSVQIVQANNDGMTSNLNRHHSMSMPKSVLSRDARTINLGRADSEKMAKIQLNQLQPSAPLPKPRKIVQMPVATLDLDETITPTKSGLNIFRRSKTSLDSRAALRSNVTTISTCNSPNAGGGYLSGKTVEIKNNLRNAAERLFSEISMNHLKQSSSSSAAASATVITKHERAVQHQVLLEQELAMEQQKRLQSPTTRSSAAVDAITVVAQSTPNRIAASNSNDNCTRISINSNSSVSTQSTPSRVTKPTTRIESLLNSPERKTAFHEMLISELAAMRSKSCSMENLTANDNSSVDNETPLKGIQMKRPRPRQRCSSIEDENDHDNMEDIDADNIEDAVMAATDEQEGDDEDDDDMSKTLKLESNSSSRKRTPSGCSTDSSPYGTERSARIRTSDWIEVGDNGKKVTMTSCHISLVDSGLEDEERLDDMSSSGVGDSWDSVKEAEKRCRSAKKIMSMSELPPLPKSLSGFNKMLASDSGLISDVETVTENLNNNNNSNNSSQINKANKKKLEPINWQSNVEEANNRDITLEERNGNVNELDNADDDEASTSTQSTSTTTTTTTTAYPTSTGTGSTLDAQLAKLKKEMQGLRHMDLSLLSQLWTLNESIQDIRTMIEENNEEDDDDDDESCSPHSPTPSTTYDTASSDGGENDDNFNMNVQGRLEGAIPKIITTQPKLRKSRSTEDEPATTLSNTAALPSQTQLPSTYSMQMYSSTFSTRPVMLPKPLELRPVPRMRSAPPPPPTTLTSNSNSNRKGMAPPRPT